MKKNIRDQILQLVPTIWEGVLYAKDPQAQHALTVLGDCYDAVNAISNSIAAELAEHRLPLYENIFAELKRSLEVIHENVTSGLPASELALKFKHQLGSLEEILAQEPLDKLEVVFMPYKSSMWDSLESIWLAAKEDERCNVTVVPIPYYDKNSDRSLGEFHYEIEQFPEYVPVVHFDSYDLSARQPDVIFIHNPYDDQNIVTTVDPRFYSRNLKPFTRMLVYVPYFISGAYADVQVFAQKHLTACVNNVDKIVVQSETHKKLYMASGVNESKLLALGSPKFDTYLNENIKNIKNISLPDAWSSKLSGKKAVILNSSIGSLLVDPDYLSKLRDRIETVISFEELVLIWRPHPLLYATITSMRPHLHDEYMKIIRMVEECGNAIFDTSSDTEMAAAVSDGMISDISSWARQYFATGKPVLMLNGKQELKDGRICVFDHFSSYFLHNGVEIDEFCRIILNDADEKKQARLADLQRSIVNTDGSCGQKVYEHILEIVEG